MVGDLPYFFCFFLFWNIFSLYCLSSHHIILFFHNHNRKRFCRNFLMFKGYQFFVESFII
jgi:hypothetical protein